MKKLILLAILIGISANSSYASFFKIENLGNKINTQEYPASSEVEPKPTFDENKPVINAGITNTITVNLEDCIALALGNNPKIQSAIQDIFISDARVRQMWSAYFPQFSWTSGYSRVRQLQLSDALRENLIYNYWILGQISASQMLYDFGVTQNRVTISKLDYDSYKIMLTGTINDVVFQVKDAFYNLQYAIESKKIAESTLKEYENFYNQAKAYYKAGTKPKVDVTIAEVNLSNAKLNLIQSEHSIKIAMAKLNNVLGIPYDTKYNIVDKLAYSYCDIKLSNAISLTEESRPEFLLSKVRVEKARQNLQLIKKIWLPQITVQGQFEVGGRHPDSNYGYTFGGYINFPTINGMQIKHQLREARAQYSKQQSDAINTRNNIYLEVQNAYYSLDEKRSKIPVALLSIKKSKENYYLSKGRYNVGVGNPIELNDAQIKYENAQLTYYKVMYEYNSAKANLEKSIGRNLASLDEISLNLEKHETVCYND